MSSGVEAAIVQVFGSRGNRMGYPDVLVILSDGKLDHCVDKPEHMLDHFKANGGVVLSVGIGADPNAEVLADLSSYSEMLSPAMLGEALQRTRADVCSSGKAMFSTFLVHLL